MWQLAILVVRLLHQTSGAPPNNPGVSKLTEVFAWKQLSYDVGNVAGVTNRYLGSYPDQNHDEGGFVFEDNDNPPPPPVPEGQEPQSVPEFVQYNNVPLGIQRWKDRMFVTVPRRRAGIPSTLNYVSFLDKSKTPALKPYPDLTSNMPGGKDPGLISVYRTKVDECGRLWMVDTGVLEIPENFTTLRRPTIVIYDLNTDKLLHKYQLKADDLVNSDGTGFASITVDVSKDNCQSAFAYLTDLANYGMVVYSLEENTSWRVYHNYFYFDPEEGDFDLNGLKFAWSDGIFSIALGPRDESGYRTAYFHSMASFKERAVSTKILRNQTLATRDYHGTDFKALGSRGPNTQSTIHGVHGRSQVMFLSQVGNNALVCWNTRKPLSPRNMGLIAKDDTKFMYPVDLQIEGDNVWVLTNNMPRFIYASLNPDEINFRVYKVPVQDAIRGTVCA